MGSFRSSEILAYPADLRPGDMVRVLCDWRIFSCLEERPPLETWTPVTVRFVDGTGMTADTETLLTVTRPGK